MADNSKFMFNCLPRNPLPAADSQLEEKRLWQTGEGLEAACPRSCQSCRRLQRRRRWLEDAFQFRRDRGGNGG